MNKIRDPEEEKKRRASIALGIIIDIPLGRIIETVPEPDWKSFGDRQTT